MALARGRRSFASPMDRTISTLKLKMHIATPSPLPASFLARKPPCTRVEVVWVATSRFEGNQIPIATPCQESKTRPMVQHLNHRKPIFNSPNHLPRFCVSPKRAPPKNPRNPIHDGHSETVLCNNPPRGSHDLASTGRNHLRQSIGRTHRETSPLMQDNLGVHAERARHRGLRHFRPSAQTRHTQSIAAAAIAEITPAAR